MIVTDREIIALAARLRARATSVVLSDQPSLQNDMRLAARILERILQDGTVHGYIRLDNEVAP